MNNIGYIEYFFSSYEFPVGVSSTVIRGMQVLFGKGEWWLAYHGIVRASMLKVERYLRYNLTGFFYSDQVWVLGLALSGEFVRVPEVLWKNNNKATSVSVEWDSSLVKASAVMISCCKVIQRTAIPLKARFLLVALIPINLLRIIRWNIICFFKSNVPAKKA